MDNKLLGLGEFYISTSGKDSRSGTLPEPGEWYLDRTGGKFYYIPFKNEDIHTTEIFAPHTFQSLRIEGIPSLSEVTRHPYPHITS